MALLERLAVQSIFYKIKDILNDNGLTTEGSTRESTVLMKFPEKINEFSTIIKPLFVVKYEEGSNVPFEIGSDDCTQCTMMIDLYAKDDGQRDDLGYLIRKNFMNKVLTVYNFNVAFPTAIGDYTGIPTKGKMNVLQTSFINFDELLDEIELSHHQEIRLSIQLPVDA
jgi:hypothetical protein